MSSENNDTAKVSFEELLTRLSEVSEPSQLAEGFKEEPQLIFDAFQTLTQRNIALETTTKELAASQLRVQEMEKAARVKAAKQRSDSSNDTLTRLVELLQPRPQKTMLLADCEPFSGKKDDYYVWRESISLKLNTNSDHFPTEHTRMAYIYSQMRFNCREHLNSWIKDGSVLFASVAQMFEVLDTLFGDPNRVRDATNRLHANFQNNRPFSHWITDIRKDASIAGYDFESRSLRNLIFYNMSLELKKALVHEKDIDMLDLDSAIARLQDMENRLRTVENLVSDHNSRYLQPAISNNLVQNRPRIGDPMDLSALGIRHQGPLTQEEKDRRRELGLCFYCGKPGHSIRVCPMKSNRARHKLNSADVVAKGTQGGAEN